MLGFEITLFNIIGACFLLCGALTFVIPVLVWAGNSICSLLWYFVDEGETAFRHRFTNIYLVTPPSETVHTTYVIKRDGLYYDTYDHTFQSKYVYATLFDTKEKAEWTAERIDGGGDVVKGKDHVTYGRQELSKHVLLIPVCGTLGAGFILIPVTTLVSGCAALSLYAMRWSRRAVKRSKKLDAMLSSHVQDPDAHKQASE